MCRNIKTLFNFEPPATDDEIRAAALQFVRKVGGSAAISKTNETACAKAVENVEVIVRQLLENLVTSASPKDREVEAAKARARTARRFGV